jgi:PAS domain S-box-containing protein
MADPWNALRPPWKRYLVGFVAMAMAIGLQLSIEPYWGAKHTFSICYLAVIVVAWYGGLGPTIIATTLGLLILGSSTNRVPPSDVPHHILVERMFGFAIIGYSTAVLSGTLHRAQRKAFLAARDALAKQGALEHEAVARREIERRFQAFMDNSPAIALMKDAEGRFVYVSEPYAKYFGQDAQAFLGMSVFDRFPEPIADRLHRQDRAVLESGRTRQSVDIVPTPDGVQRSWLTTKFPFQSLDRLFLGMVGIDITERVATERALLDAHNQLERRVEERTAELAQAVGKLETEIAERQQVEVALRQEREFIRLVLDTNPSPTYVTAEGGKLLLVNEAMARIFSVTVDEMIGRNASEFVPRRDDYERYLAATRQALETGKTVNIDDTFVDSKGRMRWFNFIKTPLRMPDGAVHVLAIATDITDRKQAEDELRNEREFLKNTLEVNERDRKLLAYEIHDGIVQDLTGTLFKLDSLRDVAPLASEDDRDSLDCAVITLRRAIDEARRLMRGLRPLVIDEAGIATAVEFLVAEHRENGDLEVDFQNRSTLGRLDPLIENTVFRIVQEALTNVARHSGAKKATVVLSNDDTRLRVEITDEGRGFDTSKTFGNSLGLEGIRKRAAVSQGTARIDSAPGGGTRVTVELPILERAAIA